METNGVISLLDDILAKAAESGASDIHLEPREEFLRVRFRIDGLLNDCPPIHKSQEAALLSRVKILVNLDIAENRLPQDGRTNLKLGRHHFDLRVSTLPTIHGEKAVIRLLNRRQAQLDLEELGMEPEQLIIYRSIIAKNTGLVLVTGPTGSGKTTTLYSTLAKLNAKERNIITIEDPVEYQLPGINQVQVNVRSGLTFARGLRAVLRQDPDIIMVGEIRDLETARIAVQSALTGHLVLATLHTNDAPSAVTRLQEMGIEKYLLEATLLGVVAQRLVRKVPKGRTALYELMLGTLPQPGFATLADHGKLKVARGITSSEELNRVLAH
ncbi:MAG TPA: GspE/PulE family protein [Candidatus Sulfotelmatobacter sp.]|nr:GspE/PulE family protein [Candidatus Sulfotelmatobacter sp.]